MQVKLKNEFILVILTLFASIFSLKAQNADSLNRNVALNSPYHTIYNHFENLQDDNYHPELSARSFLNGKLSPQQAQDMAIKLKHIFDGRVIYLDPHEFPMDPNYVDSVNANHKYVLAKQLPEIYVVKVGSSWRYSDKTIDSIDDLYKATYPFGIYKLLTWLPKIGNDRYFGLYIWQLVGLLIITLSGFILHKVLTFLIEKFFGNALVKLGKQAFADKVIHPVARPLSLFLVFWLASVLVLAIQLPINSYYKYIPLILRACLPVFATMVMYHLVDLLSVYFKKLASKTDTTLDDQLVPLVRKALKTFVVVIGIFYTLYSLNVDIIPLLTGLSIGGLAFALAAQDTIKNFFGSFMIFVDKPFQIGDWITTGDIDGTVEEVGFRSTRVRTFRNSVVYVPNGILADSTIDNHGLRVYRRFYTKLALTYDTPPRLIQVFVEGLKQIVLEHPTTNKHNFHVYMNDMGAHSLDVMFYIFFKVPSWGDELAARHDIILAIMSLAENLEVRFAFPTQTLHIESMPGKDSLVPSYVHSEEEMRQKMRDFFESDQGNQA